MSSSNVYESLKDDIVAGRVLPDAALAEATLAATYGLSRTPIREALMRLEQDGLVERRNRGLYVKARSPREILDIYETRIVLEAKAAALAAERRTDVDLMMMRAIVRRGEGIAHTDAEHLAENNRSFHEAIWSAARNQSLSDMLQRLNLHLVRYPQTTLVYPGRWNAATAEHEQILNAIEKRDARHADEVATAHFAAARDIRLRLWEEDLDSQ